MQTYAIIENDIITKFPADPVRENPNTSFAPGWQGGTLNGINYVLVEIDNAPDLDPLTQDATPQTPQKINGKWIQKIKVVDISAADKAKRKADRAERDAEQEDNFLTKAEIKAIRKLLKAQA